MLLSVHLTRDGFCGPRRPPVDDLYALAAFGRDVPQRFGAPSKPTCHMLDVEYLISLEFCNSYGFFVALLHPLLHCRN